MFKDQGPELELAQPRTVGQILNTAFRLYGRWGLMFVFLAGIIVVPFEVLVVLVEHGHKTVTLGTELLLTLIELALVDPFIAALQIQALLTLGEGEQPIVRDIIRRGLVVLPVVIAADIIAGIGIAIGVLFFVIPGVLLALRWAVVAQVAAAERMDWPGALRRSGELTRRNYWRILGLLLIVGILNDVAVQITGTGDRVSSVVLGIVVALIAHSFGTLLISLLYFDLRARESSHVA